MTTEDLGCGLTEVQTERLVLVHEVQVLRAALDHIGAMVFMDRHGNIRFKPDYSPEDMLDTVNAALAR